MKMSANLVAICHIYQILAFLARIFTPVRGSRVLLVHWRRSQQGLKRNGLNSKYGVKDGKINKIGFVHHQQETSSFQTS